MLQRLFPQTRRTPVDEALLAPMPDVGGPRQPLLIVENLVKHFALERGPGGVGGMVRAVDGVGFRVAKGETLGVVGESGCGKSTMARVLMQLTRQDAGTLVFDGLEVGTRGGMSVRELQRAAQMVFQDSHASLNPRLTLEQTIAFGPRAAGASRATARALAHETLGLVGLAPLGFAGRYPHELSGGQRQRVNIARALAMSPRLMILDESVSALDKSIEAQILNLLQDLRERLALTYVFISHDLNVVRYVSDRVLVMYLGKVVEIGPVRDIYEAPRHPYTQALLASRPSMDPRRRREQAPLSGDPPSPIDPPSGCRFRTRCAIADEVCARVEPRLGDGPHPVACHAADPRSGHPLAPAPAATLAAAGAA